MYVTGVVLAAGNSVRFRTAAADPGTAHVGGPRLAPGGAVGGGSGVGVSGGSSGGPWLAPGGASGDGSAVGPAGGSSGGSGSFGEPADVPGRRFGGRGGGVDGVTKQLLPYRGRALLDAALDVARESDFDQRIVTLGESGAAIRARVDLRGFAIVDVPAAGSGCGASVRTAVGAVDPRADGLVLLLGDQPQVRAAAVAALVAAAGGSPLGVCRYDDGWGHPFWFRRDAFAALRGLHGDKAVWKLLHSGEFGVAEVGVAGPVPIDVDTPADYERLLAGDHLVG